MFGFGRKYSKTPWKTKDGVYKCQSELCPPDMCGSGKCPLDLQTNALLLMGRGDYKSALEKLTAAVLIAADCAQIWCNIGACFGNMGDHVRARDAFRTALSYRPGYPDAQKGLEVAEKNINGGINGVASVHYMDVVEKILEAAVKKGDIKEKRLNHVPELMPYGDGIGEKILRGFSTDPMMQGKNADIVTNLIAVFSWSIYAGLGAVYEWNRNWPALKKTGLLEMLTKERGYFAMDEHVVQLFTGEVYNTDKGIVPQSCQEFAETVSLYRVIAMSAISDNAANIKNQDDKVKYFCSCIPEVSKGCYLFGVAWGLEKIMSRR